MMEKVPEGCIFCYNQRSYEKDHYKISGFLITCFPS